MTNNHAGPTVHHVVTLADRKITNDSAKKKKTILNKIRIGHFEKHGTGLCKWRCSPPNNKRIWQAENDGKVFFTMK
jgi:hypothetical protein